MAASIALVVLAAAIALPFVTGSDDESTLVDTTADDSSETAAPTDVPAETIPVTTSSTTTSSTSTTTSTTLPATTTTAAPTTVATTIGAPTTPPVAPGGLTYTPPIAAGTTQSWGPGHGSGYPAADVFAECGSPVVSPATGVVTEVRRDDLYDATIDNPALRGGRSVTILGDDGVRYYMAHFERVADGVEPGVRVTTGQPVAVVGLSGRTSACHVHLGVSPDCGGTEWMVRRGAIWPQPFLDAWAAGDMRSPRAETDAWLAANPDGCAIALADPNAPDA